MLIVPGIMFTRECDGVVLKSRQLVANTAAYRRDLMAGLNGALASVDRVLLVGAGTVHGNIQAALEVFSARNDGHDLLERLDGDVAHDEGVRGAADDGEELDAKQLASVTKVTSDLFSGKDADADRTKGTTHAVHGPDVESVIEIELLGELDAAVAPRHAKDTDDEGGPRLDESGSRSDGGETGDGADASTDEGRLTFHLPFEQEPAEESRRGGNLRVHSGESGGAVGTQRGAAVEAEPAKPEQAGTEGNERDVVRVGVELITFELLAVRQGKDGGEGGETGGGVHDDAAGEILDALLSHPATAPDPVAEREVDQVNPDEDEDEVRHEAHAIGKGASHEARRDDGKHALKAGKHVRRNGRTRMRLSHRHVLEEVIRLRSADEITARLAKAQGETPHDPDDGDETHGDVILHHNGQHVRRTHETTVEEGQTRRHEVHERHRDENKRGITRIDRHFFGGLI